MADTAKPWDPRREGEAPAEPSLDQEVSHQIAGRQRPCRLALPFCRVLSVKQLIGHNRPEFHYLRWVTPSGLARCLEFQFICHPKLLPRREHSLFGIHILRCVGHTFW